MLNIAIYFKGIYSLPRELNRIARNVLQTFQMCGNHRSWTVLTSLTDSHHIALFFFAIWNEYLLQWPTRFEYTDFPSVSQGSRNSYSPEVESIYFLRHHFHNASISRQIVVAPKANIIIDEAIAADVGTSDVIILTIRYAHAQITEIPLRQQERIATSFIKGYILIVHDLFKL